MGTTDGQTLIYQPVQVENQNQQQQGHYDGPQQQWGLGYQHFRTEHSERGQYTKHSEATSCCTRGFRGRTFVCQCQTIPQDTEEETSSCQVRGRRKDSKREEKVSSRISPLARFEAS